MYAGFAGSMMTVLPWVVITCWAFDWRLPAAFALRRTSWIAASTLPSSAVKAWPSWVVHWIRSLIIFSTVGNDSNAWMLASHCDAVASLGRPPPASASAAATTSIGLVDAGRIWATSGSG